MAADRGPTPDRLESLGRLEEQLSLLTRRLRRVITERARSVDPDLAPASYLVLAHIAGAGPMRATTLSNIFAMDKGAISRLVVHLIDVGLLQRSRDPEDGRALLLSATPLALERLSAVARSRRATVAAQLETWGEGELEEFTYLLSRFNDEF